jgi:hypothetical protein
MTLRTRIAHALLPLGAVAALLVAAAPAGAQSAASPWGAPVAIPAGLRGQELHVNPSGLGMLLSTASSGSSSVGQLVASRWSPDGTFAAPVPFAPEGYVGATAADHVFAPYASDHLVAAGVVNDADGRVWIGTGRMGARLDAVNLMADAWHAVDVQTAANAHGDLATLVVACPTRSAAGCTTNRRLLLSVRRSGHARQTIVVDSGYLRNQIALATNERGDLLVVYAKRDSKRRTHVYARIRTLSGRWQGRRDLGLGDYGDAVAAALGEARRAAVVWLKQSVSECEPGPDNAVFAAAAGLGGRWSATRRLASWGNVTCGHYVAGPGVAAAFSRDDRRRAVIAWTARSAGAAGVFSVHDAVVASGAISGDRRISDPAVHTVLSGLDVTAAGQAALVMTTNKAGADPAFAPGATTPTGEHVLAATTPALTTPFGALEDVSTNGPGEVLDGAAVAIDPVSTRALAAWSPIATGATVQTSVRSPIRPT